MRIRSLFLLSILAVALFTTRAAAQITADGSIRGIVRDEQGGALPGVTVSASTPAAGGTRTAVTDADGVYRLLNVPPGEYAVSAELEGFSRFSRPNVSMRAGLTLTIDIELKVGNLSETVQVLAETPMLDAEKPAQAVNIDGEFQRSLPLGRRREWSDFLELTPGVTSRSITTTGTGGQMYLLRGGEIDGHVVQVDGADMGSFRQTLPSYMGISTEALADVQVKTGGMDASAPLGTGVVMNIATKSGANQIKGSGAMALTPKSWNGSNTEGGTSATSNVLQIDASLGGPALRDRAWYYGAYRHFRRNTGIFRSDKDIANLTALAPGFEPFDNEGNLNYYFAKGTAQLSPSHQLMVFFQRDIGPEGSSTGVVAGKYDVTAYGGNGYSARLSSQWGTNLTSVLSVSYNDKSYNRDASVFDGYGGNGASLSVHETVFPNAGVLQGSGAIAVLNNTAARVVSPTTKTTIQGDVTYYKSGWLGSHELKAGLFLQPRLTARNETMYSNGGFAQEDAVLKVPGNPAAGFTPFKQTIYDVASLQDVSLDASDYAVYFQDAWKPTARLSLNYGLRLDWVTAKDNLIGKTLQDSLEVGPRFGATYSLTEDHRNILRASWARIAEQPYLFALPSTSSSRVGFTEKYDMDLDGSFETSFYTPGASASLGNNVVIDPDRHSLFVDEWILGYRRQFTGQLSIDASFVRRNWKDRPAQIETNGIYENGVFKGYRNEDFNAIYEITNNEANWFVYSGLEFTVTKRTKQMQLLGGYTRAFQHVEGTWLPNDPASFIQPEAFPNDKGISSVRGNETNSYSDPNNTRNSQWQKHSLRGGVTYFAPWSLVLSTNYTLLSGAYSGPIITRLDAPDPRFGPPTVTLSNGRVVQNPLATTLRFAYPTRGEGQFTAPRFHLWNVRVARDFRLAGGTFQAAFDIFNVTNNAADQNFLSGGNQLFSPNYALRPDGSFRGTNRQFARAGQMLLRYSF